MIEHMTFKEFRNWCNDRCCDGCWGIMDALASIDIIHETQKYPFFLREKKWREKYEKAVLNVVVNPINKKIEEIYGKDL